MSESDGYDEFGLFSENAAEAGLEWSGPPTVVRRSVEVDPGRHVSALVWGDAPPDLVLVHGGGQNAHTWDTVALALARPLVAIDLPGHGHSDWPGDNRALDAGAMAEDLTHVMTELAPRSRMLVGMSLGGITALALAARHPELVDRLVLVDVTPGVNEKKGSDIAAFLAGPESFASFDEILERTIAFNPTRTESSLRRGVLHNAVQRDDGSWTWRHQLGRPSGSSGLHTDAGLDFGSLWEAVSTTAMPLLLVRGGLSPVVDDDDVTELLRRRQDAEVIVVDNAGHSIQGDRPVELARILTDFLADS
ncbi:MAG TPA: alpha/beta hydrolase [Acidimicrobiales bacterium]|nr:alpha/beta hydrolase [Acidimicrobiales bacterium]